MEVRIKGKNIDVPPVIKEYILEKIARLERYLENQLMSAEVELAAEKNPRVANSQRIEVTLVTKGPLIRATESSTDMYASMDNVINKLERQIKKYKEKIYSSAQAHKASSKQAARAAAEPGIVRVKQMQLKPMTPYEAVMQMDLLGHDFFVFTNADTEEVNVVYKRSDNNYGLIEPRTP